MTTGNNTNPSVRRSAALALVAVFGLALFVGVVSVAIEVVRGLFQSPDTPLLRMESFKTADTPFIGSTLSNVRIVAIISLVAMAIASVTLMLRNRLATTASIVALTTLLGLVFLTALGGFGAGRKGVDGDRFILLESGAFYDRAGEVPFGAASSFLDASSASDPQGLGPDIDISLDLRRSSVALGYLYSRFQELFRARGRAFTCANWCSKTI